MNLAFAIRPYLPTDSESWLRCRVLSFLHTQYYDDVTPNRNVLAETALALVATTTDDHVHRRPDTVLGILDIDVAGESATIDTIAVHPDYQGHGVATALLRRALPMLVESGVQTIDAWTREDQPANAWYRRSGFVETFRYVQAHVGVGDDLTGFTTPQGCSQLITAFVHAPIEQEAQMRERFHRVYVCRQYQRNVVLQ